MTESTRVYQELYIDDKVSMFDLAHNLSMFLNSQSLLSFKNVTSFV